MKKWICALMSLMLLSCALAEPAAPIEILSTKEPVQILETLRPVAATTPAPTPAPAPQTPEPRGLQLGFEDGFALELPEGWLLHHVDEAMAAQGVIYSLSDANAAGFLHIQSWNTDCVDMNALKALIDRSTNPQTSGVYSFNGTDFVVYDLTDGDVSCCAALLDGRVLNFVFTPQSDADFMAIAARIMGSFTIL